jgi:predicted aminopeptidase
MKSAFRIILAAMLLTLAGCADIGYYMQSMGGQIDIWNRERAINDIIADPQTPSALRAKLEAVKRIRAFASRELGLPDNAGYRRYADLGRPFVVWNVFAAPEFSTKPVQWCFPIAGCVSYRGYFAKADAERFAAELASGGDDVYVGGVPAYSTLGWFADPVLNTFIRYPDPGIARLIFHELAHQAVYVRNDSVFNESFAVTVEREGVARWLERQGSDRDKAAYAKMRRQQEDFVRLIQTYRERLDALYAGGLAPQAMRERKREIFEAMSRDYENLKARWGGFRGYDRWFAQRPNNAQIASVTIYTQLVPAFQALLKREGGDLPRFYQAVKDLAVLDKPERTRRLRNLPASTTASGISP